MKVVEHDKKQHFMIRGFDAYANALVAGWTTQDGTVASLRFGAVRAGFWDLLVNWHNTSSLKIDEKVMSTAMNMLDRYANKRYLSGLRSPTDYTALIIKKYYTAGLVCIHLAYMNDHIEHEYGVPAQRFSQKFFTRQLRLMPSPSHWATHEELQMTQIEVLHHLNYIVYYPSPFETVERYLTATGLKVSEELKAYLHEKAQFLLYLAFGSIRCTCQSTAQLASMALHCAIRIAKNDPNIATPRDLKLWPLELADESMLTHSHVLWETGKKVMANLQVDQVKLDATLQRFRYTLETVRHVEALLTQPLTRRAG